MSSTRSASAKPTYDSISSASAEQIGRPVVRFIRLLPVLLAAAMGACQSAAIHTRHSFDIAASADVRQQPIRGGSRVRVGSYAIAGLRASVAERRWPLMDGYSVSHRYAFDLAEDEGQSQDVRCVLITVRGDAERERRSLHCTVQGEQSWQVELAGRAAFDGALVGTVRQYQVTNVFPEALAADGVSSANADYYVLAGGVLVATVPAHDSDEPWFAPELEQTDRGAVTATVVALLVGRDLGRGGM